MELKLPQFEFDATDPFARDPLERKASAEILTQLVSTIEHPFVLAIEAEWGRGKTTFVKMWKSELERQGFACLLYNAWENDFVPDPFVSLLGEFQAFLDVSKKKGKAAARFKKVKKYGVSFIKQAIPVAAKIATYGALDLDKINEGVIADAVGKLAARSIDEYATQKGNLQHFREAMGAFAGEIRSRDPEHPKPLIFFIDELDRCRPTYAVELLERMKHCFNVPGIVFVLAIDTEQLAHSVKTLYGADMRAEGYLRRFIDLTYRLPEPPTGSFPGFLMKRFALEEIFRARKKIPGVNQCEQEHFLVTFESLSTAFSLGLREQEHCFSWLNLVMRTAKVKPEIFPIALAFLICLKAREPKIYHDFCANVLHGSVIRELINETPAGREFFDSNAGAGLDAHIEIGSADPNQFQKTMDTWRAQQSPENLRAVIRVEFGEQLVRASLDGGEFWRSLHGLIEISEQFKTAD